MPSIRSKYKQRNYSNSNELLKAHKINSNMEKKTKKSSKSLPLLSAELRAHVQILMDDRMTFVKDASSEFSDDEVNYLATITDLGSQLRTAVVLAERAIYFKTKIS